jgi:hypothetical protein
LTILLAQEQDDASSLKSHGALNLKIKILTSKIPYGIGSRMTLTKNFD